LRILLFTNSLAGGGAERAAATLANFWAQRQWHVTVLTLSGMEEDFYNLDPRVQRMSLGLASESRHVLNALAQNIRRMLALRRVLLQVRPAIAISLMSTPNVLLALAARGIPNLSTVGSERDYPPHAPLGAVWTILRKKMYGRLHAMVVLTRECADWISVHSSATRIAVIPNAVTWPLPDKTPRLDPAAFSRNGRKTLLAVGRLSAVKNFSTLIRVFSQLAEQHADWDLFILGEGPERPLLESIIRSSFLNDRVFLPGIAGNVGNWYARADLYVMTSHSEGFPNTLAEALCHGLPAISFDCDTGPRDIIRHDIDGLLVAANDSTALALALERLMGDANLRKSFALAARATRERFSVHKVAAMWDQLFAELMQVRSLSDAATSDCAVSRHRP